MKRITFCPNCGEPVQAEGYSTLGGYSGPIFTCFRCNYSGMPIQESYANYKKKDFSKWKPFKKRGFSDFEKFMTWVIIISSGGLFLIFLVKFFQYDQSLFWFFTIILIIILVYFIRNRKKRNH